MPLKTARHPGHFVHPLAAHGLTTDRKGLLSDRLVWGDVIGGIEEALVDLRTKLSISCSRSRWRRAPHLTMSRIINAGFADPNIKARLTDLAATALVVETSHGLDLSDGRRTLRGRLGDRPEIHRRFYTPAAIAVDYHQHDSEHRPARIGCRSRKSHPSGFAR